MHLLSFFIRISLLKDLKSFIIVLEALCSTLSMLPVSLSSTSNAITTDPTLSSKSSGGVGHGVISSQRLRMSLGVVVAIRQLQRACKVLTNIILFKGKDFVTPLSSLLFPFLLFHFLTFCHAAYSYPSLSILLISCFICLIRTLSSPSSSYPFISNSFILSPFLILYFLFLSFSS